MNQPPSGSQWICFHLANEIYAVPALTIQEITPYSAPNPCPGSPSYVEGILDIRGTVITVFCGRQLIAGQSKHGGASHIIVVEEAMGALGISIEGVEGMTSFYSDQIQANTHRPESEFIIGTVNHKDKLVILIDLARCCGSILDKEKKL